MNHGSLVPPEQVGMSKEQLLELDQWFLRLKVDGRVPGCVLAVARDGKVCHFTAQGERDIDSGKPMTDDTIFRIFSLSKVVTGIACMQLYEKGLFQLDDPIHKFLPQFKEMTVMRLLEDGTTKTEPMKEAITVRHLFTHTSGLTYGIFNPTAIGQAYEAADVDMNAESGKSLEHFANCVAKVPLMFQPGEAFQYGISVDILGRLVEIWSGLPFAEYLGECIFKPLGMKDTGFFVPAEHLDRLATLYHLSPEGSLAPCEAMMGPLSTAVPVTPPSFASGGGGLVSTPNDYLKLALMLAGGGTFGGKRILGRKTVELMTRNHLPKGQDVSDLKGAMPDFLTTRGLGVGLGVFVVLSVDFGVHCSPGTFFWQGMGSTYFFHDPVEKLTALAFTSFFPCFHESVRHIYYALRSLTSQALL